VFRYRNGYCNTPLYR